MHPSPIQSANDLLASMPPAEWVRIAPQVERGALIEVCAGNRSVKVGRFLRAELRPALAREIRQALNAG